MPLIARFWTVAIALLLVIFLGYTTVAQSPSSTVTELIPTKLSTSVHLLLGNPSNASENTADLDNYLITKPQYALSYNNSKGIANWVSWNLSQSWLGDAPRQNDFRPDRELPKGVYKVTPKDYTGSGFDRGHMISSEDRGANIADNSSTFLMDNIVPQSPDNNRGPWVQLETYSRNLIKQGKELYIIAGGAGVGGTGENGAMTTLANGKVTVPASTWKVVVVLDQPDLGIKGISNSTRVISVVVPNSQGIKSQNWKTFRKSVDEVETLTGYDLLSNVPEEIQAVIEGKVDQE
ncbi:DNA/RNA non-specific endonuclease [Calothrix sp. PCC 7507]|uniref:DNA/RNA non-specific endonuclease n=1 Tax=Calothrix sp. PCC 7507 TaxID=99598 RepID=UPI00029ED1C4|nr:DNA/RNA non-specific endonuclease [Calothrix sp. PCC 7507]AFY33958.1 DNA/RNA non-specific endonuclease [Calothrix sp. PCC 7507]